MAKYQAYAEYKDSGAEWLGNIPKHWKVKKLKYLGEAIIGLTYSPDDVVDESEGTLVLRSSNIQNKKLAFEDNVYVRKEIPEKLRTQKNDILICARNGSRALIGKNALIDESAEGVSFGAFMSIFRSEYNSYLSKVFNSALFEYQSGTFLTATINQLTTGNLNSFEVPLPPLTERNQISNFLDYETRKIDHLIQQQQQLIELLKEKRQAVISHAVTKGLDPNVPMKDSGVEWLGEVPEHWGRSAIKNLCYVNDGNHGEEYPKEADFVEENEGVPFIRAGDFDNFQIISNNLRYLSHEKNNSMRKGRLQENDILFVNRGATIGKLCIIDKDYAGSNLNSQIAYLRANKNSVDYRYLTYFLSSAYIQTKIASDIQGGALPQYPIQNIVNLDIWFGDLKEQTMIADYLDHQVQSIICLINKCESAIQLMQERRTALISAAVTGKIDVRNWQAPMVAEADTELSA